MKQSASGESIKTSRKLTDNPGFYILAADLVLRHDIMLEAIAVAGEIMTVDARLCDYGGVLSQHIGINDPGDHFDIYEALLDRFRIALQRYDASRGDVELLREMIEIKDGLFELNARE